MPILRTVSFALLIAASDAAPAAPRAPDVRVEDFALHYPVTASTVRGINAQLRRHAAEAAQPEQGNTRSHVEVTSTLDPGPEGCSLRSLEVAVQVTTTLPEWRPDGTPSADVRRRWENALARLERHEAGHRENALSGARALRTALLGLPRKTSCLKLQVALDLKVDEFRQRILARDDHYDRRTPSGLRDDPLDRVSTSAQAGLLSSAAPVAPHASVVPQERPGAQR